MFENIKEKIGSYAGKVFLAVTAGIALVPKAFAQTPAYTMNTTVTSSVTDLLSSMVSTIFSILPTAIGIVGALTVTLFGIKWLVGFARGNMHG
jgi:hypothetical protein